MPLQWLIPDWPVKQNVQARVSTRLGGCSDGAFSTFNLAEHVGDCPEHVSHNRLLFAQSLGLQNLVWGRQVHGVEAVCLPLADNSGKQPAADAFYTHKKNQPCLVMTADCLPVFFSSLKGDEVAVAHAGWRGLAAGVLANTIAQFDAQAKDIVCYLGPAIGPGRFQVGFDVYQAFSHIRGFEQAFNACSAPGFYLADLYYLARLQLCDSGIAPDSVYGGEFCTFEQKDKFFSYRRDATQEKGKLSDTGRMASVIWLA